VNDGTLDTYRDLPPAQALVMEVLAARARLGEGHWTFSTRHRQVIAALELRGLVASKSGITERTCLAWLTDKGREATQSATYKAPALAALDDLRWLLDDGWVAEMSRAAADLGAARDDVGYWVSLRRIANRAVSHFSGPTPGEAIRKAREGITP
jgi:hypothetical protein